ncbi:hypothetical protein K461DRAFT_233702 [Myriangium duriaei CBS 260.36]|uniref:tRNA (guanine(37)-N1)-methyltransferase n=1 Tax=Myriangium duriaei CBS 260.36 TaxID=1168546 RepID=A0A9P4ISE5_9PEZI|nr:hypothetical protein K461DRAFT_233702 [Myriangium duriaei CBS 260.36]
MAEDMFRPPINRTMRVLDRSFFQKRIPLSAVRVLDHTKISQVRTELTRSKDILNLPRYQNIREDKSEGAAGHRCILLRPQVNEQSHFSHFHLSDDAWPWSSKVNELQSSDLVKLVPFDLDLDYKYWQYADIADAILPHGDGEDVPSSFQAVGHVAHLNLREQFLPYKHIIAELIVDKNTSITTVINKIDDVGEENAFRTFRYEVLAGPNDLNVEVKEQSCIFRFDYAKVYWNSRLNTEHERMVSLFQDGEAVCDVMAGIGPFALPAGKKKVFVWANDLNPESYRHLGQGIQLNKLQDYVKPFNEDGHKFIKDAALQLAKTDYQVASGTSPKRKASPKPAEQKTRVQPKSFSHYVMNLPASATDFLPNFVGLYSGEIKKHLSDPKMPMIHCYCFETKSDDNVEEGKRICELISKLIGYTITPETPETTIWDVRDVAPKKRMFCASFRLPKEVALREVE